MFIDDGVVAVAVIELLSCFEPLDDIFQRGLKFVVGDAVAKFVKIKVTRELA